MSSKRDRFMSLFVSLFYYILGKCSFLIYKNAPRGCALRRTRKMSQATAAGARVCLKNHSCNLHAPLCGIFCLHSVDVARYAALIQTKSPTNCDIYLAESIFKTHSGNICICSKEEFQELQKLENREEKSPV